MATEMNSARIVIERNYTATVHELWELWTTPAGLESWWGPEGFRVEVHTLEAQQEGLLHYTMIADAAEMIAAMEQMGQPTSHGVRARFSAFSPETTLTISSVIDFLPGVEAYESRIDVQFATTDSGARMVITLHAMHDAQFTEMQREGFSSQLRKLDKRYL